jgi:hypothetical protein
MTPLDTTPPRRARAVLLSALAGAALLLGGCSFSFSFGGPDLSEIEDKLVEEQKKVAPGLDVGAATCPDDVEVEEGTTFECTVEVEGVEAPYDVTLNEIDGDTVNFDSKPAKPIINVDLIVDFLRGNLNAQSQGAEIDCGDETVLVTEVGATIDCTVSDARGSETVSLVVKNLQGDIGFAE